MDRDQRRALIMQASNAIGYPFEIIAIGQDKPVVINDESAAFAFVKHASDTDEYCIHRPVKIDIPGAEDTDWEETSDAEENSTIVQALFSEDDRRAAVQIATSEVDALMVADIGYSELGGRFPVGSFVKIGEKPYTVIDDGPKSALIHRINEYKATLALTNDQLQEIIDKHFCEDGVHKTVSSLGHNDLLKLVEVLGAAAYELDKYARPDDTGDQSRLAEFQSSWAGTMPWEKGWEARIDVTIIQHAALDSKYLNWPPERLLAYLAQTFPAAVVTQEDLSALRTLPAEEACREIVANKLTAEERVELVSYLATELIDLAVSSVTSKITEVANELNKANKDAIDATDKLAGKYKEMKKATPSVLTPDQALRIVIKYAATLGLNCREVVRFARKHFPGKINSLPLPADHLSTLDEYLDPLTNQEMVLLAEKFRLEGEQYAKDAIWKRTPMKREVKAKAALKETKTTKVKTKPSETVNLRPLHLQGIIQYADKLDYDAADVVKLASPYSKVKLKMPPSGAPLSRLKAHLEDVDTLDLQRIKMQLEAKLTKSQGKQVPSKKATKKAKHRK
jgi:hypothetical protein